MAPKKQPPRRTTTSAEEQKGERRAPPAGSTGERTAPQPGPVPPPGPPPAKMEEVDYGGDEDEETTRSPAGDKAELVPAERADGSPPEEEEEHEEDEEEPSARPRRQRGGHRAGQSVRRWKERNTWWKEEAPVQEWQTGQWSGPRQPWEAAAYAVSHTLQAVGTLVGEIQAEREERQRDRRVHEVQRHDLLKYYPVFHHKVNSGKKISHQSTQTVENFQARVEPAALHPSIPIVITTRTGECYHKPTCPTIQRNQQFSYRRCRVCFPDPG